MLLDNCDKLIHEMLGLPALLAAKEAIISGGKAAIEHLPSAATVTNAAKNMYSGARSVGSSIASHAPTATQLSNVISHPLTKKLATGALVGGGVYMAGKGLLAHKAAVAGTVATTKMLS